MWSARDKAMTYDEAKNNAKNAKKDIKMVSEILGCLVSELERVSNWSFSLVRVTFLVLVVYFICNFYTSG